MIIQQFWRRLCLAIMLLGITLLNLTQPAKVEASNSNPHDSSGFVLQHVRPECKVVIDSLEHLGGNL